MASRIIAAEDDAARSENEDVFITWPSSIGSAWRGSFQQLQDEGLFPSSLKPPKGCVESFWTDGVWAVRIKRARPRGTKIPITVWKTGDHWRLVRLLLRRSKIDDATHAARFARFEGEVMPGFFRTHEGRLHLRRSKAAKQDKRFQAMLKDIVSACGEQPMSPRKRKPRKPQIGMHSKTEAAK